MRQALNAIALLVEHNRPEPAPLADTSARVVTLNYSGNGGVQTFDFGVGATPTVMFVDLQCAFRTAEIASSDRARDCP